MKKKLLLTLLVIVAVLACAVFSVSAATDVALTGNETSRTVSTDTVIDLNGYNIGTLTVTGGAKVTIKDSKTDDYSVADDDYGRISTITISSGTVAAEEGYMQITEGNVTSFHRLNLNTVGISLRPSKVGLYYQSQFGGDEVVKRNIVAYGVAMSTGRTAGVPNAPSYSGEDKTYTREDDLSTWECGKDASGNSLNLANGTILEEIMKPSNKYTTNQRNAKVYVNSCAYVELPNGDRIEGALVSYSLKDIMTGSEDGKITGANDAWRTFSYSQRNGILDMCEQYDWMKTDAEWIGDMGTIIAYADNTAQTKELYTAADVLMMADRPNQDYTLMANIDMSTDSATYKPLANYANTFNGNGYTISNLKVSTADADGNVGFLGSVAAGGSVTNLHIRDAAIVTSKTTAQNIGVVAGLNNGSITGVTTSGTITDTRTGAANAKINVGALVGKNSGTVTAGTTNTITVSNARDDSGNLKKSITDENGLVNVTEGNLSVSGLSADVGLFTEKSDNVNTGLVGTGTAATNAASVYWRDRSYSTERQAAELQRRRQLVVDDVYEQGTIKWTPASTIKYWNDQTNNPNMEKPSGWWDSIVSGKWHIHNQTFNPGTTYYGIPYTHCASPIEQAKYYMTEGNNGVYTLKSEVTSVKGGKDNKAGESTWTGNGGTDKIGWGRYFGSDCSGGLTGAWHKVSPIITSGKDNNGVCLFYTTNMVPSQYNQWYYGFKQVGDYEVDDATWSGGTAGKPVTAGGVTMTDYVMDTDDIMAKIGATGFYEAYAQSQMGDIVVAYSRTGLVGHARMIADDPVVIRNGNGVIDATKSYFLFHEQGAGLYTSPGISSWRVNWKCSFAEAAMQSGQEMGGNGVGYYLPITMNAFHNTKIVATGGIASGGNVITGNDPIKYALNSSYRIMSATMVIKDAQGNTVYEATRFQGASTNQNRRRAVPGFIPLFASDVFSDCDDNLVEGNTYYVTFSGTTYGGVTNVKMDNYQIVYAPTPAA